MLNLVLIPTLNVDRRLPCGHTDPGEVVNQSLISITTAGYKGTFTYDNLIQTLCQMVASPDKAIILGGSWRVPYSEGQLNKNFVSELKASGSYKEESFDREYESKWAGDIEYGFYNADIIERARTLPNAEDRCIRPNKESFYVLGVDVGRFGCNTEIVVLKVSKKRAVFDGSSLDVYYKKLVNIYSIEAEHFGAQAIQIKRLFNKYKARVAVIDGNGLTN